MFIEPLECRTHLSGDSIAPAADALGKTTPQVSLDVQLTPLNMLRGATTGVHDIVTDHVRHQILGIGTNTIARFDQDDGEFLGEWQIDGQLGDADITPDGKYLYCTQEASNWILKVDLETGAQTSIFIGSVLPYVYPRHLVMAKDRVIFEQWGYSDIHRLYQINLADDQFSTLLVTVTSSPLYFVNSVSLARTPDFNYVAIVGGNVGSSAEYYYDATTGVVHGGAYSNGPTSVAVNSDHSFRAELSSGSAYIYDGDGDYVTSISLYDAHFIFNPHRDIFYIYGKKLFNGDYELITYDTTTWQPIDSRPMAEIQFWPGTDWNISDDGDWLLVPTQGTLALISTDETRSSFGSNVTMTAHVESDAPTPPTGSISFINATTGKVIGNAEIQFGDATIALNTLHAGAYEIIARYNGDNQFNTAQSAQHPLSIIRGFTWMFASGDEGDGPGFNVIVGEGAPTPVTGTVEILENNKVIASGPLVDGKLRVIPKLSLGFHDLWARYLGSSDNFPLEYRASQRIHVTQSSTTTLVSSSPAATRVNQDLVLTAKTTAGGRNPHGLVSLYNGQQLIRTVRNNRNGVAVFNIPRLAPGKYRLSARFLGTDFIAPSSSRVIAHTVVGLPSTVSVSAPATVDFHRNVKLTAHVRTAGGKPIDEGTVIFKCNNRVLAEEPVFNGIAAITTDDLDPGINRIAVIFIGRRYFEGSTSRPITIDAIEGRTFLKLSATRDYLPRGETVTFAANVMAPPGDPAVPQGKVVFKEGTRTLATVALDTFATATFEPSSLKPGLHSITASYSGDSHFKPSASKTVKVTIVSPITIDLMILYTPAALDDTGSLAQMHQLIGNSISEANQAFWNSHLPLLLNLVYSAEVDYHESGKLETDLARLTGRDDGFMDSIHDWRNDHGADLVSLFEKDGNAGGLGWQLRDLDAADNPNFGFSIVLADQAAAPYYTLAHELGHNLGATHDDEHREGSGATSFSNGWRFRGKDGVLYHDIMSYDPGDTIPYFSNPRIKYQGVATGDADTADSARTITLTAPLVASYRRRPV